MRWRIAASTRVTEDSEMGKPKQPVEDAEEWSALSNAQVKADAVASGL
ncbi:hypothetical protein RSO01_25170 [Reyranella soli]|uniref:Uncharacterized protein n=1 Tax=Reyranella soli TaxID=1230389 RepID=A0A512N9K1_9HYPH|nr:hypothetical protein RSO01_25170 [Reyranella soli]